MLGVQEVGERYLAQKEFMTFSTAQSGSALPYVNALWSAAPPRSVRRFCIQAARPARLHAMNT